MSRGRAHDDVGHDLPRVDLTRIEADVLEQPQRAGSQAVAAALVARKSGPVDEHDVVARARQRDGGSSSGGATADHGNVSGQHAAQATDGPTVTR